MILSIPWDGPLKGSLRTGSAGSESVMPTDTEIARRATLKPIQEIGEDLGIPESAILPHGRHSAKIGLDFAASLAERPRGKLILVTAITPTQSGEEKRPWPSVLATD